jgi:RHS repeat-associated protein
LNRVTSTTDRDGAVTYFAYDPINDLTNRTMPGNLQWQASYNSAGQMSQEQVVGGGNATRTTSYTYYSSGPFTGLLYFKTDGRGTTCSYLYDDWLAATNMVCTGALPEQNLTTTWSYDARRNLVGMTEQFANQVTGPSTSITRSYNAYGELSREIVGGGSFGYSAGQFWDVAGRRSMLGFAGNDYSFGYQGDGSMISAGDSTGTGAYTYSTAGILTNRTVGIRSTGITSLDGEGRPLTVGTTIDDESLNETLSYSDDGLLESDTLNRPDFTDSRIYNYASLSRRLTYEQLNLNSSASWTNNFSYDNGTPAGPGALTLMGQANGSSGLWGGGVDSFSRINSETNNTFSYPAYGHVNGQATLSAWLDGNPVSITGLGTNAMQWEASMEISPGNHQLTVAALHPSGRFTALATNYFTNTLAYQQTVDSYDANGDITNRVWENPSGTIERTQSLSWDARGRLHAITQRDASNSGYNWSAVYDPLNRRVATTTVLVTNGLAYPSSVQTINSYFDPQVEFLEVGVAYGTKTEWKLYGPGMDGQFGEMNGVGALDAVSPELSLFNPTITDVRGNILGFYDSSVGIVNWSAARPTGYGAVPGYRPMALASGADLVQASAWRGRWVDITGYYNIGLRPYDPISGRWLTYDSSWNAKDPNYYSFCGGDPINSFDSDGRIGSDLYSGTKGFFAAKYQDGYMPADANSAFATGDYYGSMVRGAGQQLGEDIDNVWNGILLAASHPSDAPPNPQLDQEFLNDMPLASPMKNWAGVDYGDNAAGNSFVTTFAPLTQNAINSYGVGESTVPHVETEFNNNIPQIELYSPPSETTSIRNGPGQQSQPIITVLGSSADVAPYAGQPGYNVLKIPQNIPENQWDAYNQYWLMNSYTRGDTFWLVTEPNAYSTYLQGKYQTDQGSALFRVEMPMLNSLNNVNAVPAHMFGGPPTIISH